MSVNSASCDPPCDVDWNWYRAVDRVVELSGGEAHKQLEYVQRCVRSEANGEAPSLPTPDELDQLLANMGDDTCSYVRESLDVIAAYRGVREQHVDRIQTTIEIIDIRVVVAGEFDDDDEDDEDYGERCGIQFTPSEVDNFLQTLPRVEISMLDSDEVKCSICKLEYGIKRGGITTTGGNEPALEFDQGLPGEEVPERPVKLPCRHIFGEWCIKTWLLEQPASCPTCRLQFEPILPIASE